MLLHKWSGAYESMIYCVKKFGHPHLAIAFPVLSFFPCWEVHAGGIPLACLHGHSWLWGERRLAIACPSDNSCLTVHQHPLGPSFSSPFGASRFPLPYLLVCCSACGALSNQV